MARFRSVVNAALGMGSERWPGCGPDCVLGCGGTGQSQIFRAVAGQVAAVRGFVRLALAGHPAADDAVAVASELAANSVAHSRSGRTGGMFTVHVVALGEAEAGLAVTELRGDGFPGVRKAGEDAGSGFGLRLVRALTSLFWVSDAGEIRILLATVPAPPGTGGAAMASAGRPLPGCPARAGAGGFGVDGAEFVYCAQDCRDNGDPVTEVFGFFCPPGWQEAGNPRGDAGAVHTAVFEVPAGSAISRLAHQASTRAGIALIGEQLRAGIARCPCTRTNECAALDELNFLAAIEHAAQKARPARRRRAARGPRHE